MGVVLDKLWDEHGIVCFCAGRDFDGGPQDRHRPVAPDKCLVIDGEYYNSVQLTKAELLALAKEIEELAHGLG